MNNRLVYVECQECAKKFVPYFKLHYHSVARVNRYKVYRELYCSQKCQMNAWHFRFRMKHGYWYRSTRDKEVST